MWCAAEHVPEGGHSHMLGQYLCGRREQLITVGEDDYLFVEAGTIPGDDPRRIKAREFALKVAEEFPGAYYFAKTN